MIVPPLWENVAVQGPEFPLLRPAICSYNNNTVLSLYLFTQLTLFIWGSPPFSQRASILWTLWKPFLNQSPPIGWLKWGSGFILRGYNSSPIRCPLPLKAWAVVLYMSCIIPRHYRGHARAFCIVSSVGQKFHCPHWLYYLWQRTDKTSPPWQTRKRDCCTPCIVERTDLRGVLLKTEGSLFVFLEEAMWNVVNIVLDREAII